MDIAVKLLSQKRFLKLAADLNREQLAKRGENDEGEPLQPPYTEVTNMIKTMYKQGTASITEYVTLYDTGDLHKSIQAQIVGDELILGSFDEKVGQLTAKYGEFLGLTDDSIKKLQERGFDKVTANVSIDIGIIKLSLSKQI